MMKAVLSNANHPEYGVAAIPLPFPEINTTTALRCWRHWRSAMPLKPTAAWTRSIVLGPC